MHYVYILKSVKDQKLYIGMSSNLRMRIRTHNEGRVRATKNRSPLRLIYYEAYLKKTTALKREIELKRNSFKKRELFERIFNTASSSSG